MHGHHAAQPFAHIHASCAQEPPCAALLPRGAVCATAFSHPITLGTYHSNYATSQRATPWNRDRSGPRPRHQLPWLCAELLPRDRASDHLVSGRVARAEAARIDAVASLRATGGKLCGGASTPPPRECSRRRLAPELLDCPFTAPISGQLRDGGTLPMR